MMDFIANPTEKDCIAANGVCHKCASNPARWGWESLAVQGCQVKYSTPVCYKVGLPPKRISKATKGLKRTCVVCGTDFLSPNGADKACLPCSGLRKRGQGWYTCEVCGQTRAAYSQYRVCKNCRGVAC